MLSSQLQVRHLPFPVLMKCDMLVFVVRCVYYHYLNVCIDIGKVEIFVCRDHKGTKKYMGCRLIEEE